MSEVFELIDSMDLRKFQSMKPKLLSLAALLVFWVGSSRADLIISGVVDGTNASGTPKAIELYALHDIPDLSLFSVIRDTNGDGPFDSAVALPSVALTAGDFFYIAANASSASQLAGFGFAVGVTSSIANVNGDDVLGVGSTGDPFGTIFDSFGVAGQGDTDFYQDSFAVRTEASNAGLPAGLVDAANFAISAYTDAGLEGASGFGSYSPHELTAVPEASTLIPAALLCGSALLVRRRSALG